MIILRDEQGSEEWLQSRLGVVTASNFGKIVTPTGKKSTQVNDYINKLVAESLTGVVEPFYKSDAMQRGNDLEPAAKSMYELIKGLHVDETGLIKHDTLEAGCSPDGIVFYFNSMGVLEPLVGIEIKCPLAHNHVEYLRKNEVPSKYIPQIQGCMWITGAKYWDFMSYNEYLQPLIIRVERDEEYISKLEEHVTETCNTIQNIIKELS
jgi:predicted phage-related endonuclease